MDVNNNPDNPIIGVRAYGADPELVAQMGTAAIRGYQETGLLACAKHFPGHGDTSVDSHLALPVIPGDRRRLESVELIPFRAAISAGVGAIMTTDILFPALDAERPATLSSGILTGLLREQLGYDGLVITDCLEMKAIVDTVGTAWGASHRRRPARTVRYPSLPGRGYLSVPLRLLSPLAAGIGRRAVWAVYTKGYVALNR